MIQLSSTEVFFPYVCVLLSSLFIYQYLSDVATRIPLGYNSEYKNKILVSKETEMRRGSVKLENLVLSNEFRKVELQP